MNHIKKNSYLTFYNEPGYLESIFNKLLGNDQASYLYIFCNSGKMKASSGKKWQYNVRLHGDKARIRLSYYCNRLDEIEELKPFFTPMDTADTKRLKGMKYICAKAHYLLVCKELGIRCIKDAQHKIAIGFAVSNCNDPHRIYNQLLETQQQRATLQEQREASNRITDRFHILDL